MALSSQLAIDFVRGPTFDRIHNPRQRMNLERIVVNERREDHVHMVRHDYDNVQFDARTVLVQTAVQY